jgi:import receptor subunit TOM70
LIGDTDGAKADLEESVQLVPSLTQSWVKIASVHMERGDPSKTFEAFDEATKHNESDPDIYYHRGQGRKQIVFTVPSAYFVVVFFILNEFDKAAEDYTKSTELDDTFVFSHIQLAVAQYKSGDVAKSMATFRRTLKAFPDRSEPQNY